jgi:hypothetical protein
MNDHVGKQFGNYRLSFPGTFALFTAVGCNTIIEPRPLLRPHLGITKRGNLQFSLIAGGDQADLTGAEVAIGNRCQLLPVRIKCDRIANGYDGQYIGLTIAFMNSGRVFTFSKSNISTTAMISPLTLVRIAYIVV